MGWDVTSGTEADTDAEPGAVSGDVVVVVVVVVAIAVVAAVRGGPDPDPDSDALGRRCGGGPSTPWEELLATRDAAVAPVAPVAAEGRL